MKPVARTLLGVLGLWHALAAVQNVFAILVSLNAAPGLRPFASKNAEAIGKLLERLHPSKARVATLLAGVSAMEAAAAVGFLRGAIDGESSELGFVLSLTLFGAFFIVDDAFDGYDMGADHRAIFTLLAASYAACKVSEA